MIDYVLGVDLGTSGVKAGVVNLATLKLECESVRSYAQGCELNLEILWGNTVEAIKEAVNQFDERGTIRAIGITGQMHGAVLYDRVGNPIGPLINWKDQKWSSKAIIQKMKLAMGDSPYDELGTDISSGYSGAILFGIKENNPDLFRRIAHFVLPTDFLRGKFLGDNSYATDPTNAFGTGLFNTRSNRWHEELIRILQLPINIFPEIYPSSQIAGEISNQVADLVGLSRKVPIIYGAGDNQVSMLGSGLAVPESPTLINIGTAAQISKLINKFHRYSNLDTRPFFMGAFAIVGASLGGGGSYQWLRDQIEQTGQKKIDYSEMNALAATAPPGADGLVFCTGPTRQSIERRRGFYGNTARLNSIAYRAKAVMEGVLMDLFESYEIIGHDDFSNFLLGAGKCLQKSRVWSQTAADLFGKPVKVSRFENGIFGAALMAAFSLGAIEKLEQSSSYAIGNAIELTPDPKFTEFYQGGFIDMWRSDVREK